MTGSYGKYVNGVESSWSWPRCVGMANPNNVGVWIDDVVSLLKLNILSILCHSSTFALCELFRGVSLKLPQLSTTMDDEIVVVLWEQKSWNVPIPLADVHVVQYNTTVHRTTRTSESPPFPNFHGPFSSDERRASHPRSAVLYYFKTNYLLSVRSSNNTAIGQSFHNQWTVVAPP